MPGSGLHKIFVYGSLRRGFHSPAYEYISRYFSFCSEAKVKGRLYDMGEYPAAVPTDDEVFIIGELYQVKNANEFSWAIAQLDDYEWVHVEPGEPQHYKREVAQAICPSGTENAWIYWFNGDVSGKPQIASGDVLQYFHQKK